LPPSQRLSPNTINEDTAGCSQRGAQDKVICVHPDGDEEGSDRGSEYGGRCPHNRAVPMLASQYTKGPRVEEESNPAAHTAAGLPYTSACSLVSG
jgi:hypothetical protein